MKRILAIALALVATAAFAATTWTEVHRGMPSDVRCVKGAFTLTTETAPTAATDGITLSELDGLSVEAEAISTMTAGGKFVAYLYNPTTGNWAPAADGSLDLTASAVPRQAWSGFTVTVPHGRIAWEPSGIGTASDIYVCGRSR